MRNVVFATTALLGAFAALAPASATPGKSCDQYGCWTYNCDATSNHCHRHWVSGATGNSATQPAAATGQDAHSDQICDSAGNNCQPEKTPN